MSSLNLHQNEEAKINCAKKLFAFLSSGLIMHDHVDSFQ